MGIKFDFDELKRISDNVSDSGSDAFSLEDIMKDFGTSKEEKPNFDIDDKPEQKKNETVVDIDDAEIIKPAGVSITGAFEAIKSDKSNKTELREEVTETVKESKVESKTGSESVEIVEEIKMERFFDTETFESIKERKTSTKKIKPTFSNDFEEEDDGEEEYLLPVEPTEEIDDYNNIEDKEVVTADLKKMNATASFKTLITFVLLCFSGVLFLASYVNFNVQSINEIVDSKLYVAVLYAISAVSTIVNINPMIDGIKRIIRFRCTPETLIAAIFIFNSVLNIKYLVSGSSFDGRYIVFDFIYMLLLFFNVLSRKIITKNILKNFLIISSDGVKSVINNPISDEIANDIILETGNGGDIVYASKSKFVSNYIHNSFKDYNLGNEYSLLYAGFLALLLIIMTFNFYLIGSLEITLIYITGALCALTPALHTLSYAMSIFGNSKRARRQGGAIIGSEASETLNDVQTVIVDDSDVFSVTLNGIRLYGDNMIDKAILYLSALFRYVGGPLDNLFSQMLSDSITSLPKIHDAFYHDKLGYSCLIDSKPFVVGNKDLMDHFGVEVDDGEYELIYKQKTKHVLFVAYNGKLMGVFILSYSLSFGVEKAFKRFEKDGLAVAIAERDANVNEATLFGIYNAKDRSLFKIMNYRTARNCFDGFEVKNSTSSKIVSNTGLKGLAAALHGCKNIVFASKANTVVKIMSSVIATGLITFLLFFSEPTLMLPIHILLYQLLWALPIAFVSIFYK